MMNGLNATVKDEHRKRLEVDHSAAEKEKRTSPAPSAQPQDPRLLAVVAWRAVSYTHLTLPTILRV